MAEEIKQVFIIDGSQALAEISRLNKSFATLDTNLKKNSGAMGRLGKAATTGAVGVQKISISFQTLARIVSTQVIVRAMSRISVALKSSVQDAIDFEKQVAEISTISAVKNLDQLKEQVRGLSDAFNRDLGDVGKGLYQVISNQIADAGEATEFLTSALKFSKVAVTDTNDSVNLLAGVINAYGLEVSDADTVSAKLFKTIELGRTTGPELANSLGRVIPVAAQLGIRLEEVSAAIADVTLTGVKTNEAVTQLRGLLTSLLKPTTAMKEAMQELGFSTGEEIIAALGLQGAFKALVGTTDGTSIALAKLVPRVRGLNALIRIATDSNSKFAVSLEGLDATGPKRLADELARVVATDAEQLTNELNQIKNIFTAEFGAAIVEVGNEFIQLTKGAGGLTDAVKSAAAAIIFFGKVAAGTGATLKGVSVVLAKFINLFQDAPLDFRKLSGAAAAFETEINKALQVSKDSIQERLNQEQKLSDALDQEIAKRTALLKAAENKRLNTARTTDKEIITSRKSALAKIVDLVEESAQEQLGIARKLQQDIVDSESRSTDIKFELANKLFKSSLTQLNPQRQLTKLQSKQNKVISETNRLISQGGRDEADNQAIENNLRLLDTLNSQTRSLAEQSGKKRQIKKSDNDLKNTAKLKLKFEESIVKEAEKGQQVAIDLAGVRRDEAAQLKKTAKTITELSSRFDADGKLLDDKTFAKQQRAISKLIPDFEKLAKDAGLTSIEIDSLKLTGSAAKQLSTQVKDALKNTIVDLGRLSVLVDVNVTNADEAAGAIQKLLSRKEILQPQAKAVKTLEDNLNAALKVAKDKLNPELEKTALAGRGTFAKFAKPDEQIVEEAGEGRVLQRLQREDLTDKDRQREKKQIIALQKQFNALSSDKKPLEALKALNREVNRLGSQEGISDVFATQLGTFQQVLGLVQPDIVKFNEGFKDLGEGAKTVAPELEKINTKLKAIQQTLPDMTDKFTSALNNTGNVVAQVASASTTIANNAIQASNAAKIAADAFAKVSAINTKPVDIVTAANGRRINRKFFAHGGRGADQISAMLSPGERVINARSSRNFASQLEAINAGHRPVFRENGGTVNNNITVRDINVQGGETSKQTARSIAAELRRELRRNASALN